MHHRDVELKAIRLQSTKERRDTSYPPTGDSLKGTYTGMCLCTEYGSLCPLCPKQDIWMYEDVTIEVL